MTRQPASHEPADPTPPGIDERTEMTLGTVLRVGVVAAGAIVLVGGIAYLVRHGGQDVSFKIFRGVAPDLRSPAGIFSGIFGFHASAVIQFGLLVLIATPVLRVLFSVVAFARKRDRLYVTVTLVVLGILALGLWGGR